MAKKKKDKDKRDKVKKNRSEKYDEKVPCSDPDLQFGLECFTFGKRKTKWDNY